MDLHLMVIRLAIITLVFILLVVIPLLVMVDQAAVDTVLHEAHKVPLNLSVVARLPLVILNAAHLFPRVEVKDFHMVHLFLTSADMDMVAPYLVELTVAVACVNINF